jgi:ankyrin repeat protein
MTENALHCTLFRVSRLRPAASPNEEFIVKTLVLLLCAASTSVAQISLLESIRTGDSAQIDNALKSGADPNSKDNKGVTALMYAAAYLPASGMQALLDAGSDVNQASDAGSTPLMTAIGDPVKVRMLVQKGANVNAMAASGNTALVRALQLPSGADTARFLFEKGAKPNPPALSSALRTCVIDLARKFLEAGVIPNPAALTASLNCEDAGMLRTLLDRAPKEINATFRLGEATVLMAAAHRGSVEMARVLIERGALVNARDTRGRTPLMYAAGADRPKIEMVRFLLERGADPAAKDNRGSTALAFAVQRGLPEMIRALGGTPSKPVRLTSTTTGEALPSLRESLTKAMALLDDAGPKFVKANGCISCHNQSIPQMAGGALRHAGIGSQSAHTQYVLSQFRSAQDALWETACVIAGGVARATYGLVGLNAGGEPRSPLTDQVVRCMAELQQSNGSWGTDDSIRPPLGGAAGHTALAIRSLQVYAIPGRKEDFLARIENARRFLQTMENEDTQSLAFRILGLKWAKASNSSIQRLGKALAKLQRPGGGWAQHPEMEPDAYATGQALWALREGADWKVTDKRVAEGALYLRRTQKPDGAWHVRSRAFGFQPYRDTGFPYHDDQWISSAATGFAVLALAPLVERGEPVVRARR